MPTSRSTGPPERRSDGAILIRGARQNNLANVDVRIPRNRIVAITGVSG
jgi:excinuclease ABC subunit A